MDNYHIMIALLLAGFLLLGIGFTNRETGWGVALVWAGWLVMLIPIGLGIYVGLH